MALGDGYQPYPVAPRRRGVRRVSDVPGASGTRPGLNIPGQSYLDLIKQDPGYQRRVGENTAASLAGAANRAAAIRSALARFGSIPGLDLGGNSQYADWLNADIDPATRALAAQNTTSGLSLTAQLEDQHKQNQLALEDQLAARGILSSGQTGFETGRESLRHTGAKNSAVQELLQFILGQYGGFAEAETGRATALGTYGDEVAGNLQEQGIDPAPGGMASYDPSTGSFVLNGQHYDEAGNPITAPPPLPQAPVPPSYATRRRALRAKVRGHRKIVRH